MPDELNTHSASNKGSASYIHPASNWWWSASHQHSHQSPKCQMNWIQISIVSILPSLLLLPQGSSCPGLKPPPIVVDDWSWGYLHSKGLKVSQSPWATTILATLPCSYSALEFIRYPGVDGELLIQIPSKIWCELASLKNFSASNTNLGSWFGWYSSICLCIAFSSFLPSTPELCSFWRLYRHLQLLPWYNDLIFSSGFTGFSVSLQIMHSQE